MELWARNMGMAENGEIVLTWGAPAILIYFE
jgi:hypothetical protein